MGLLDWVSRIWRSDRSGQRALGDSLEAAGVELRLLAGGTPPRKGSRELLKAYAASPWLHAVVRRRAEAVASVEWEVYRRRGGRRARGLPGARARGAARRRSLDSLIAAGELQRLEEHPFLDLLWRPNPVHTGYAWAEITSKHLDLLGEAFDGLSRASSGRPDQLWPIPPPWVTDIPAPDRPYFVVNPGAQSRRYPAADVLWLRQHDPLDPYRGRGVGTAASLGDELETDEYMAVFAKARFYNRATPETIIGIPNSNQVEVDRFLAHLEEKHRGPAKAGQIHAVGKDVRVQQVAFSMVDSQYVEGRAFLRDTTMQVFGVPPEILGVLENANRSTIDAAELLFAKFSTVPMLDRLRADLEENLLPLFGEDLWLDYVSPVPADREYERQIMVAIPGAFKVDEIRAQAGRPALPNKAGDGLYLAPGAPGTTVNVEVPGADTGPALPAESVQDTALNGAQVASLLETLVKVGEGTLPKASAKAVLAAAFPALEPADIDAIVDPLEAGTSDPARALREAVDVQGLRSIRGLLSDSLEVIQ